MPAPPTSWIQEREITHLHTAQEDRTMNQPALEKCVLRGAPLRKLRKHMRVHQ